MSTARPLMRTAGSVLLTFLAVSLLATAPAAASQPTYTANAVNDGATWTA